MQIFNRNYLSKFRLGDLREEMNLRKFIMKLKCDNQWENATIFWLKLTVVYYASLLSSSELYSYSDPLSSSNFSSFCHKASSSLPSSALEIPVFKKTCNSYALIHHVPWPHYPGAHKFNRRPSYLSIWCQTVSPFSHPLCVNYATKYGTLHQTCLAVLSVSLISYRNLAQHFAEVRFKIITLKPAGMR